VGAAVAEANYPYYCVSTSQPDMPLKNTKEINRYKIEITEI
jgi:hypothetical protein